MDTISIDQGDQAAESVPIMCRGKLPKVRWEAWLPESVEWAFLYVQDEMY